MGYCHVGADSSGVGRPSAGRLPAVRAQRVAGTHHDRWRHHVHIIPNDCNPEDYGDGRGESDCLNGNTKSVIQRTRDAKLGQTLEYKFDFWVDPDFGYEGEFIREALEFRPEGWDSRLRIASWEGPFIKNFIYMLKLDAKNGSTFFGRVCQAPDKFGSWVTFSMKIRWANDGKGWVKVTCDDQIIYADEAVSTTAQIQCYAQNEMRPWRGP